MLKTLKLENFTVFPKAELEFSPGLNVIVGENGTGKSHLLKLGYAVLRLYASEKTTETSLGFSHALDLPLMDLFYCNTISELVRNYPELGQAVVCASWGDTGKTTLKIYSSKQVVNKNNIYINLPTTEKYSRDVSEKLKISFIPPKEILSIFYGFQAALENRELGFDATYLDISKALNRTPLKGKALERAIKYVNMVERVIGGEFLVDGGKFYFSKTTTENKPSAKIAASMTAEGHRKIGMLAYLIKNGSLGPGSSLFWDEPEANLNPKLQAKLAEILVELSSVMQITIATHSLFLLREIEILQEENRMTVPPKFFGLHFNADGGVEVTEGKSLSFIGDTVALDMEINQSTRYLSL